MNGERPTLADLYREALRLLPSRFEAGEAFRFLTGRAVRDVLPCGNELAPPELWAALEELALRRGEGEPLQYLLGEWEFYSLPFAVGPGVLIPRPETELLVDLALDYLGDKPAPSVLDLCSGSGCVAVALKKHRPAARVTAVERSPEAFVYLTKNIAINDVAVEALLADATVYRPPEPVDLIVSNPPYIPRGELAGLQAEVRREPELALDGGADGLDFYRCFARLRPSLRPGGRICLEVGARQHGAVEALLRAEGFGPVRSAQDLAGIPRVVWGENPDRNYSDCKGLGGRE